MDDFVRRFIRSSVLWLGIGITLGVTMSFAPQHVGRLRTAHLHANLLGFVSMMIFGVGYHVLPRFASRKLHAPSLARVHLVLANLGLALQVLGWILGGYAGTGAILLRSGAAASAVGAFLFIYNMWQSVAPGVTRINRAPPAASTGRPS